MGAHLGWGDPGKAGFFEVSTIEAPDSARHSAEKKRKTIFVAQNLWVQLLLQLKLAQNACIKPWPYPRSKLLGVLVGQSVLLIPIDKTKPHSHWAYFSGVLFLHLSLDSFRLCIYQEALTE